MMAVLNTVGYYSLISKDSDRQENLQGGLYANQLTVKQAESQKGPCPDATIIKRPTCVDFKSLILDQKMKLSTKDTLGTLG